MGFVLQDKSERKQCFTQFLQFQKNIFLRVDFVVKF